MIYVSLLNFSFCSCDFLGGSDGKDLTCNAIDLGSVPGSGGSPGEENGNPLQYSCLGNLTDRGAWWATVPGVTKSRTQLSDQHFCSCMIFLTSLNCLFLAAH